MFKSLVPKEYAFFDYFENHSNSVLAAAQEFKDCLEGKANIIESSEKIKRFEKEADAVVKICADALHKTFITPFDRADILSLIKKMDSVLDNINGVMSHLVLYEISEIRSEAMLFADILLKCSMEIHQALRFLKNSKDWPNAKIHCDTLHILENDGDRLMNQALGTLFKEKDAVLIIKWKEIFERMEKGIDKAEDVGNVIEGIIVSEA